MSNDEVISTVVDSFLEVRKLLDEAEDFEQSLTKKNSKQKSLLQKSKEFVDKLYTLSDKVKTNFYKHYNKIENEFDSERELSINDVNYKKTKENSVTKNIANEGNSEVDADNTGNNTIPQDISVSDIKTDNIIEDGDELNNKAAPLNKSIIRVVDLNKLIDPKQKKSVKFDSSVIILTSSDDEEEEVEESSNVPPPKGGKENGLRSAIKSPQQKHVNMSKTAADVSEDDKEEIKENNSPDGSRKSSRLRNCQIKKEHNREELKKIFKRSSDKHFEIISKKSKRNCDNNASNSNHTKNKSTKEDILSNSSSDSDTEGKKSRRENFSRKSKLHPTDSKFERKVYVPLPLIQCDKLKEVYNSNKDIFACTSATRSSKRIRRTSGYESDNESSQNKRCKSTESRIDEELNSKKDSTTKDNLEDIDEAMPDDEENIEEKDKRIKKDKKASKKVGDTKSQSNTTTNEENESTDEEVLAKKDEDKKKKKKITITNDEDKITDNDDITKQKNQANINESDGEEASTNKEETTKNKSETKANDDNQITDGNEEIETKTIENKDTDNEVSTDEDTLKEKDKTKTDDESGKPNENEAKINKGEQIEKTSKINDESEEKEVSKKTRKTKVDKIKIKNTGNENAADDDDDEGSTNKETGKKTYKTKTSNENGSADEEEASSKKNKTDSKTNDDSDSSGEEVSKKKETSQKINKTKTSENESEGSDKEILKTNENDEEKEENEDKSSTKRNKTKTTSAKNGSSDYDEDKEKKKTKFDSDKSDEEQNENVNKINSDSEQVTERKEKSKREKWDSESDSDAKTKEKSRKETARKAKKGSKMVVLSDSDDEKCEDSDGGKKSGSEEEKKSKKKNKKRVKKAVLSDSEENDNKDDEAENQSDDTSSDEEKRSDSDNEKKPKKSRIKKRRNSSSSDSEEEVTTRKHIRRLLDKDSLSETTKQAEEEEKERKARIAEKQKKYNRMFEEKKDAVVEKVVLDYDEKTKEERIAVHKNIVKNLKPHQVSGIQFMYDACFESVERTMKSPGSGCILAHCMGLGKTLQVVALTHTLLKNSKKTKVEKVMVVCPINTVLNWKAEYKKWVPKKSELEVFELATSKKNYERQYIVKEWHEDGGILIIGYTMFRNLSNPNNRRLTKKMRACFQEGLVDPGPDIVICDEGHLLKNEKTHLSIAMNRIKTARRIVLTGTPLQNNLKEYWCMVQFIKPNLLGTYKEYMNRFVNPITNGQYTDSTQHDIVLMRKRSHVLHKLLDGVVQRRDYSVLEPYLPPKHEYVLFVNLSQTQIKMYKHYMEKLARKNDGSNRTSFLFTDFQQLQRICTHPRVLADKTKERKEKWDDEEESEGSLKDFINDDEVSTSDSSNSSNSNSKASGSDSDDGEKKKKKKPNKTRVTRALAAQRKENNEEESDIEIVEDVKKEWWQEYCDGEELDNIANSGKLSLFFEIVKECEEIGDKLLVFSQSLYTLNCIEYFLNKIDEDTQNDKNVTGYKGTWSIGLDYFRLDGSSSCDNRAYWCDSFNSPDNTRARLFLISTKAGGLGINLVAANRVIIFDVSWNPSHDIQSIYRVYRFGQNKPCYIYRFVTYGAMEMKIYERQVTKQAISKRVIDEQQIDRHYNQNDLQELYQCDLDPAERPLPMVPKDVLLGEMLQKYDKIIYKYHLHQSLLENKQNECLNEDERKAAWEEFENEKVLRKTSISSTSPYLLNMSAQAINSALINIVRRDNPNWSDAQIKGIIPALVRQLQIQIEENDMSMYQRVVQEIQIMNQAKMKESYYQQQMMKYYQQQMLIQKRQQAVLGNLNFNPQQLQNLFGANANFPNGVPQFPNGPSTSSQNRLPNDVIELND